MGLVVDGPMDLGTHIWDPPQIFLAGADDITGRESLGSRLASACLVTSNALCNLRLLLVFISP